MKPISQGNPLITGQATLIVEVNRRHVDPTVSPPDWFNVHPFMLILAYLVRSPFSANLLTRAVYDKTINVAQRLAPDVCPLCASLSVAGPARPCTLSIVIKKNAQPKAGRREEDSSTNEPISP
ncbi:hypothetical protein BIW11_03839 [Tropilaelaps mercedesae]|uniref:Uncharacterized protein n=1 Tax=Tropilaelaps mercedesae TaxID=418985 RepID=A0A1V9XEY8_9ACAR|nr:hypothetical protein BIW11_03839 [Tropilaelaps mercedesae]